MGAAVASRFCVALAALGFATAQPALGCGQEPSAASEEHQVTLHSGVEATENPPTKPESPNKTPLPICSAAEVDEKTLPVVDAWDLVAEQLRKTIVDTSEGPLREKLRLAYFRYLGCN
jgi:hypothetical protein